MEKLYLKNNFIYSKTVYTLNNSALGYSNIGLNKTENGGNFRLQNPFSKNKQHHFSCVGHYGMGIQRLLISNWNLMSNFNCTNGQQD